MASITTAAQSGNTTPDANEIPVGPLAQSLGFGSDVVADTLRALEIPFVTLNPGSSFRGLHDSIVNYLGNETPKMLLCLHEEHAVSIAHGYSKVTGRAMAAIVHSNVGLMHATMAVFNAWCDRAPVLLLGATGPVDAMRRRNWIDWIHTARDQGGLLRSYTKWDDQPGSPGAAREAVVRANWLANAVPRAPVYVNLDVSLQEDTFDSTTLKPFDIKRYSPKVQMGSMPEQIDEIATLLRNARSPLILMGRVSRSETSWNERVALVEHLNANVMTDVQLSAAFPTLHPLHRGAAHHIPGPETVSTIREADVILALDWVDLGGLLHSSQDDELLHAKIINVSLDHTIHNGWSMDYQPFPPCDLHVASEPDHVVSALCAAFNLTAKVTVSRRVPPPGIDKPADARPKTRDAIFALRAALGDRTVSVSQTPNAWQDTWWPFDHPLDYTGNPGGGGIGAGPGIAIGAALALRDSGRFNVALLGDGDFLMGSTAIWTAVHYDIPLLIVVGNNNSFYNDEMHQERVAKVRGRPPQNKWIGQKMIDPSIDIAQLARSQGATGLGPIETCGALGLAFAEAIRAVEAGGVAVVDVRIDPGYD